VHSRRLLGAVALTAIVIAAMSFGVVDVSIADANGCVGTVRACTDHTVPPIAIAFAALGVVALLASIVPTVQWIVDEIHAGRTSARDAQVDEDVLASRRTRSAAKDSFR
jgi:hypothetical protein